VFFWSWMNGVISSGIDFYLVSIMNDHLLLHHPLSNVRPLFTAVINYGRAAIQYLHFTSALYHIHQHPPIYLASPEYLTFAAPRPPPSISIPLPPLFQSRTITRQRHTLYRRFFVRAATMPGYKQYLSLSAKTLFGPLILLLLAVAFRHSSEPSISSVATVHDIAGHLRLDLTSSKVGIPFGKKNSLQAIDYLNATFSGPEPSLPINVSELWKREFTW